MMIKAILSILLFVSHRANHPRSLHQTQLKSAFSWQLAGASSDWTNVHILSVNVWSVFRAATYNVFIHIPGISQTIVGTPPNTML